MTREQWEQAYKDRAPVVNIHFPTFQTWVPASPKVREGRYGGKPLTVAVRPMDGYADPEEPHWPIKLLNLRRLTAEELLTGEVEDPCPRT